MRPYLAILTARIRMLLQYRAAAFAGLVTQLFWGWIKVMVFAAFYAATGAPQPMSLQDTITYIWLGQALLLLLPFRIDAELQSMVRDGSVAYELTRPADLYWYWFSRQFAARLAPLALRAWPQLLLAGLFFGMELPVGWTPLLLFLLSLGCALLLLCGGLKGEERLPGLWGCDRKHDLGRRHGRGNRRFGDTFPGKGGLRSITMVFHREHTTYIN